MADDIKSEKRKRTIERKILAGDNVEVFFTGEGLSGSWHAGVVIELGSNSHLIESTNLLTENEQSKLVERIPASETIEGIYNTPSRQQRGSIRPFPPPCVFPGSVIKYGLCVDAWLYDAWWEGVVFDKNEGSQKRKVFFPDIGDQCIVAVDQLRITQEWNECSGHWKPRGEWVLLQVLHELEKEGQLPVSIGRIWYDLRSDISFIEKIGSWTAGTHSVWYGVVNDLYQKLLSVVDGQAVPGSMVNGKSPVEHFLGSGDNLDAICSPDILVADDHTLVEHANNNLRSNVECTLYNDNVEEEVKDYKDNLKPRMGKSWLSMPVEGEQCLEAIASYSKRSAKARQPCSVYEDMKVKMRKHLAYLGWKIESKRDRALRYRYTSPDGEIFYSLTTVCSYFTEGHQTQNSLSMKQHEHEREKLNITSKQQASKKGMVVDIPEFTPGTKMEDFNNQLNSNFSGSASSKVVKQGDTVAEPFTSRKQDLILSASESMDQPVPEDLRGAIQDYCKYMSVTQKDKQVVPNVNAKLLRLKAKRYLSFMGWKFWFISKKTKEEIRYDSPYGKTYCSLHTACKAHLEDLAESSGPSSRDFNKRRKTCKSVHKSRNSENSVNVNTLESRFGSSTGATCSNNAEYVEPRHGELCSRGLRKSDRRKKEPSNLLMPLRPSHEKLLRYTSRRSDFQSRETKPSHSSIPGSWSSKGPQHAPLCPGKRNAKTVLCSLIDKNVVLPREKVSYIRKRDGKVLMQGRITRDGIKCECCQQVFTLTKFEAHAGSASHRPAANIFLNDRRSLLQCQKELIHVSNFQDFPHPRLKSDYSQSPSDSICSICQDGGILLLCDHCPSAFHQYCVGLELIPVGKWFCPCCKCGICGMSDFNSDTKQFTGKTIIYCDQCQREFHVGCLRESGVPGLTDCPTGDWFCSKKCSMVFLHLQKLLGKSNLTPVEGLSWSLYRSSRENGANDIESIAECHSKLRVALDILHECFVDIIEPRTKSDLVADLLFNRKSDLKRLNFWGFYTMVLERGDELISVATFRIFGDKVAEMPLIGTLVQYRRQGMCRLLVNELEKLLLSLGVEMLILPAVPQLLQTWTTRFGFTQMTSFDRLKLLDFIFLNFQDTCLCYKLLAGNKTQLTDAVLASTEATNNNNNASETILVEPIKCLPVMEVDTVHSAPATNTESAGQIVPYNANDGVALGSNEDITSAKGKLKPTTYHVNARTLKFYYRRRIFAG
ncbi:putative histone acetyltransferase chromatin regulator PHD family [Dioscorea sansibarensis]